MHVPLEFAQITPARCEFQGNGRSITVEYIDFDEILQHGDPGRWKPKGLKHGSGILAHSPDAPPGTRKIYEIFEDEFGEEIEVHYFRHPDGRVSGVKVSPRT